MQTSRLPLLLVAVLGLAACGRPLAPLSLQSGLFADNGPIGVDATCDGRNLSPSFTIAGVPPEAKTLGVMMHDLDNEAGAALHWAMWNVPADVTEWGVGKIPTGAVVAQNDAGIMGYSGPCRVLEDPHHYVFEIYAFDRELDLMSGATKSAIAEAFETEAIAKGTLTATYTTKKNTQPAL